MKSLNKVLDILETFLTSDSNTLRLTELANLTGLHKATVNRIVSTLVKRGYLSQLEKRGKYTLGTRFLNYSSVIKQRIKIADLARPHLIKLNKLVKESATLFTYDHGKIIFIEEIHSSYPLRIIPDTTTIPPLYCTAIGKVYLANLIDSELEGHLTNTELKAFTVNTITDINLLKKHLIISVAKEGTAYDDEEWLLGVRSVAAGIRDSESKLIGAVSVIGPSVRLTRKNLLEIAPEVKHCAMKISLELGYNNMS